MGLFGRIRGLGRVRIGWGSSRLGFESGGPSRWRWSIRPRTGQPRSMTRYQWFPGPNIT